MPHHNMFSDEVREARRKLREIESSRNKWVTAGSYKEQALYALAKCLESADTIDELTARLNAVENMLDGVTPKELSLLNGAPEEKNKLWLARFGGVAP